MDITKNVKPSVWMGKGFQQMKVPKIFSQQNIFQLQTTYINFHLSFYVLHCQGQQHVFRSYQQQISKAKCYIQPNIRIAFVNIVITES